ncbi:golgin subfamily A member 6-like protein 22 [Poecilia reticulata]|uniref:golgin subfamily A member 6-like protein 22 n=1 Tax=Poecilia reticulata TaxID=8081 RepID=UPI0004A35F5B|nr:PREDICTED: golgin subfamily A member 6-like protein 22 [Poecilia reticulata]
MASFMVPEFPAVVAALERLKDLERELREDKLRFSDEGCVHLTAIAEAVAELEATRRAVRELLEVETIENCKLRYTILNMTDCLRDEILRDKAAARAVNAEEIEQLHRELRLSFQTVREKENKLQEQLEKHELIQGERDRVRDEHKELIASLNVLVSLRYSRQQHLDETLEQTEQLRNSIVVVEQQKLSFKQSVALERERFSDEKKNLDKKMADRMEQVKQERKVVEKIGLELKELKENKREMESKIEKLFQQTTEVQDNLESLKVSYFSCEQQLQEEMVKNKELNQQIETQEKHSEMQEEVFNVTVKNLQKETIEVEDGLEDALAAQVLLKESLAYHSKLCKRQLGVEEEVAADHQWVSTELERSRVQLEERIASIVKQNKDIMEMEKIMQELLEDEQISRRIAESRKKELIVDLDEVKLKIKHLEEKIKRLNRVLETKKRKQQNYEEKMTSSIHKNKKRYEALLQERAALLERHPDSENFDLMLHQMALLEKKNRETQSLCQQEVDQIIAGTEKINRSIEEKEREQEELMKTLKEVETKWREEKLKNDKIREQKDALTKRKSELEQSIQDMTEHTRKLLAPRDEMKAELGELHESHINMVNKQNSVLREMEVNMYGLSLILGQIKKENSRLQLSIRQMMEDISTSRQEKERYQQEVQEFSNKTKALFKEIQEGFRQDNSVIKGIKKSDNKLLSLMGSGLKELKNRNLQLMSINTLLHQAMLEFSKRLGDKAIERWQQ